MSEIVQLLHNIVTRVNSILHTGEPVLLSWEYVHTHNHILYYNAHVDYMHQLFF